MPPLVQHRYRPRVTVARHCWQIAALSMLLAVAPTALSAQSYLTLTDDAAPVPKGVLRVKAINGWTRFDERFTATGKRSLADEIATDSLGVNQFPQLAPVEQGLKSLTNDPNTRLTFGRLAARSDARVVRTPFALEYGLTRRLSIGLVVPVIQTRRNVQLRPNLDSAGRIDTVLSRNGNVGWVPDRSRKNAAQANGLVYSGFFNAADSISKLIARCPTNPTAAGCAAVLANSADANATLLAAEKFAAAVKSALGIDSASAFVSPRANSALANAIHGQIDALNAKVRQYLGATAGASSDVFNASTPFSYIDLQGRNGTPGLLESALGGGRDSVQTTNQIVVGVTLSAEYLLFDRFQYDTLPAKGLQTRMVIGGAFRYEPPPDTAHKFGVIPFGDGSGIELHSAMDVVRGRFGATINGRFVKSLPVTGEGTLFGDPEAFWSAPVFGPVTRTAGTVIGLDVTPRFFFGEWFALDGHYGFERQGATTYDLSAATATCEFCPPFAPNASARTSQVVGLGFRYSTAEAYLRGKSRTPIEVSFAHLETISGDPGVPKSQRDQIQVRFYFRVRSDK